MRKLISIVLTAVMAVASVLAFTGCSGNAGGEAASSFKVGAIYINSKNDTAGYTYAHHKGITEAMKQCGLDPEKDLYIVDNVPEDDFDCFLLIFFSNFYYLLQYLYYQFVI